MLRLPPTEIKVEAIEVELQLPSVLVAWEGVRSGTTWACACWVVRVVFVVCRLCVSAHESVLLGMAMAVVAVTVTSAATPLRR